MASDIAERTRFASRTWKGRVAGPEKRRVQTRPFPKGLLPKGKKDFKFAGRGWGGASHEPPLSTAGDPLEFARSGRG